MLAAFYQQTPSISTPYRQLIILSRDGVWQVRLSGGTQWRPKHSEELKVIPAKSFVGAEDLYHTAYQQLRDEGWKPYSSFEPW